MSTPGASAETRSLFFARPNDLTRAVDEIETREDCLAAVVELEKSTLQYYEALREALGEDKVLDNLVEAERSHLRKATQYMITGAPARDI